MRPITASRNKLNPFFAQLEGLEPRQMLAAHIANNPRVYATIQAAVDAAAAGSTITVDAGTYPELVTVSKTLTIRGARAGLDARGASRTNDVALESVVRGQMLGSGDRSTGFLINANNVVLDGFTVQDDSSVNVSGAGIVLSPGVSGTHIINDIVQHNVAGMYLSSSSATVQTLIQHNVFLENNNTGQNSGRAIYSDGGVSGGNLTNVLIDSNTFKSNSGVDKIEAAIGLEAQSAGKQSNVTISNNTFTSNGKAVLLINATNITIRGNTITGSTDSGSAALRLEGGDSDITIFGNTVKNNLNTAVKIDENASAIVNSNVKINQNNFIGNAQGGLLIGAGAYVGTLNATHNYWGSASGPSGDATGSGDSIVANGVAVTFSPFSATMITNPTVPTSPPPPPPPPVNPPPVTQPPVVTPPPAHHKKHKCAPRHLSKAQNDRLHRLEMALKRLLAELRKHRKAKRH